MLPRLTNAKEVRTWNLFATLQFLSEQVWSPTTFASGLTEMTRQQKHKRSGLTTHSFFYVKKKKNRVTSSVLLNVAFVCNFAYLNYIMNFSKVKVRDLASAKSLTFFQCPIVNLLQQNIARVNSRKQVVYGRYIVNEFLTL